MDKFLLLACLSALICLAHCQVTPVLRIIVHHPPPDKIKDKVITSEAGDVVEMECIIDNMPIDTKVQWFFFSTGSQSVVPISDGHQPHDQNKYKVERGLEAENSYKLTVQALVLTDSGDYQCKALYNDYATPISETYTVVVSITPYISSARSSTDIVAKAGDDVNLECAANGVPPPDITWRRAGGQPLPTGGEYHSNHLLTIRDMKPDFVGFYICEAQNKIGTASLEIFVDMRFAPIVQVAENEAYQKPGYVKDLVCSVTGNPLPLASQISWSKNGQPINNDIDPNRIFVKFAQGKSTAESRLSIRPVQEGDFGVYRCTAINADNQASYGIIKLTASQQPTASRTGLIVQGSGCQRYTIYMMTIIASVITSIMANIYHLNF